MCLLFLILVFWGLRGLGITCVLLLPRGTAADQVDTLKV